MELGGVGGDRDDLRQLIFCHGLERERVALGDDGEGGQPSRGAACGSRCARSIGVLARFTLFLRCHLSISPTHAPSWYSTMRVSPRFSFSFPLIGTATCPLIFVAHLSSRTPYFLFPFVYDRYQRTPHIAPSLAFLNANAIFSID